MSPETIELILRAQEIIADSQRVSRQTAELTWRAQRVKGDPARVYREMEANSRLRKELRKRVEQATAGSETILRAASPSAQTVAVRDRPIAQASCTGVATK
jgi:hypothetical protein